MPATKTPSFIPEETKPLSIKATIFYSLNYQKKEKFKNGIKKKGNS